MLASSFRTVVFFRDRVPMDETRLENTPFMPPRDEIDFDRLSRVVSDRPNAAFASSICFLIGAAEVDTIRREFLC